MVAEIFPETERVDHNFPSPSPHRTGDFPTEQLGGRSGKKEFRISLVEQAAGKGFPTGNQLDLVEKKGNRFGGGFRKQTKMRRRNQVQVFALHPGQTLVFKVEINQTFRLLSGGDPFGPLLMEKAGFSGTPHADHRHSFVADLRQLGLPAREGRRFRLSQNLFADDL